MLHITPAESRKRLFYIGPHDRNRNSPETTREELVTAQLRGERRLRSVKQLHSSLIHNHVTCITVKLWNKFQSNHGLEFMESCIRSTFI